MKYQKKIKSYFIVFLILISATLYGQTTKASLGDNKTDNTKSEKKLISGFGNFTLSFGAMGDNLLVLNGGGGAFLVNQKYYFGIYGVGIFNGAIKEFMIDGILIPHKLEFGHGGLYLGYVHNYKKIVHLGFSSRIGLGDISYKKPNPQKKSGFDGSDLRYHERIFSFYPQVEIELALISWFRINMGLGYQIVLGLDLECGNEGYNIKDFNTPMLTIAFAFGNFEIN